MRVTLTIRRSPGGDLDAHRSVRVVRAEVYELTFDLPINSQERFAAELDQFIAEKMPTCLRNAWTIISIHDTSWELANRVNTWLTAWIEQQQDAPAH